MAPSFYRERDGICRGGRRVRSPARAGAREGGLRNCGLAPVLRSNISGDASIRSLASRLNCCRALALRYSWSRAQQRHIGASPVFSISMARISRIGPDQGLTAQCTIGCPSRSESLATSGWSRNSTSRSSTRPGCLSPFSRKVSAPVQLFATTPCPRASSAATRQPTGKATASSPATISQQTAQMHWRTKDR